MSFHTRPEIHLFFFQTLAVNFGQPSRQILASPRATFWSILALRFGQSSRYFLVNPRATFWSILVLLFGQSPWGNVAAKSSRG